MRFSEDMIAVVGSGPAGNYLAYLLAKKGKEVTVIEEHNSIGKPVQCTGIVTSSINKFLKLKKSVIANTLEKVVVMSKNNKTESDVDEIVLRRDKFDQFLADMAIKQGTKILLDHRFINLNGKNSIIIR